jgi:hypothetical protein
MVPSFHNHIFLFNSFNVGSNCPIVLQYHAHIDFFGEAKFINLPLLSHFFFFSFFVRFDVLRKIFLAKKLQTLLRFAPFWINYCFNPLDELFILLIVYKN